MARRAHRCRTLPTATASIFAGLALHAAPARAQSAAGAPGAPTAPAASAAPSAPSNTPSPTQVAQGRQHFEQGLALFRSNDFNGALAEFQLAYELSRRPSVLYNLGVTYQELHQYPQAARTLEQYLRDATDINAERREAVSRALTQIRQYVAYLRLVGLPERASVRIDGERIGAAPFNDPISVSTGRHTIEVVADGYRDASESVLIAGGQTREVRIDLRRVERATTPSVPGIAGPSSAVLAVQNAPRGARVELDGRPVTNLQRHEVPAGPHTLRVRADGFSPYEGAFELQPGARRTATVRLASTRGLSIAPFVITGSAAVVFAAVATVTGVMTQGTYDEFSRQHRDDPAELARATMLASQGSLTRDLTNAFFVCAGISAATAVVLATQTRFTSAASVVEWALSPARDGASASARVTF